MEIRVGDKVSFLNQKGGGIVVKLKDKNIAMVMDDDGFETPYAIKQLVKVHQANVETVIHAQVPTYSLGQQEIALLFVPKDHNNLQACDLDLHLANTSGYNFYFELYQKETDKVLLFSAGQLNHGMTHFVKTIKREEIELYCRMRFQCIFNDTKKMEPLNPFATNIAIKASKFYKDTTYQFSGQVNNKALIFVVAQKEILAGLKQPDFEIPLLNEDKEIIPEKVKSKPHDYARVDIEIDLHIAELLEDFINVSAQQMLAIQMNVFRKELEKAIQLNYASVTFIHGIGKGVLKDAIQQELNNYKGIKHYPANFQRYGNGATKVEII
jgi:hypothetical protein